MTVNEPVAGPDEGVAPTPLRGLDESVRALVVGAISNSIVVTDAQAPDNPIVYVNPAFERSTGYSSAEVLGRNCRFLQGPGTERTAIATMRQSIQAGHACAVTLLNYRKDGTPFWQELSLSPVRSADGVLLHFVGVQTDLQARKQAEENALAELVTRKEAAEQRQRLAEEAKRLVEYAKDLAQQAQRLAEERLRLAEERQAVAEEARRLAEEGRGKAESSLHLRNEVLATVAHDLRTPLTAIQGTLDLMLRRLDGGQDVSPAVLQRRLLTLRGVTARMNATLQEIMDVAQLWIGQELVLHLGPVDMVSLTRRVIDLQESPADDGAPPIALHAPHEATLVGDRIRLERVLGNVVGNAVKYSRGKPIDVTIVPDDEAVVVRVTDQGVGIPEVDLPHIFTRFFRASTAQGTVGAGIGLAGARAIVRQHGGDIAIKSTLGAGSTVTITLPRMAVQNRLA